MTEIETTLNLLQSQIQNLDVRSSNITDRLEAIDGGDPFVRNFLVAERTTDIEPIINSIGRKVSNTINGTKLVNYPTGLIIKESEIYIISYKNTINSYTPDFKIHSVLPIPYEIPLNNNTGIAYSLGGDVSKDGDIAIASWKSHIVRIYNSNGILKFTIGSEGKAGDVNNKRLYHPRRCWFLENGNILVLSYRGKGDDGTKDGHISEYDSKDGKFIKSHLKSYGDGKSVIGKDICYRPIDGDWDKLDPDILWVSEIARQKILKYSFKENAVVDIIHSQEDFKLNQVWGVAACSNGLLALAAKGVEKILIIDPEEKYLVAGISPYSVGSGADFRDIKELNEEYLIFTDWSTKSTTVIPQHNVIDIQYNIPDMESKTPIKDLQYPNFDSSTGILSQPLDCLNQIPDKIAIPFSTQEDV